VSASNPGSEALRNEWDEALSSGREGRITLAGDRILDALDALAARLREAEKLVKELEQALARERGGGTPLPRFAYLDLRSRARAVLAASSGGGWERLSHGQAVLRKSGGEKT
jgi:hypothetical protein